MSTDKPIKLSAKLPKEDRLNGLGTIHEQVARHGQAYIIASVVAPEVLVRPGDIRQPTLVIDWIEGLPKGELAARAEVILRQARTARENALVPRPEDGTPPEPDGRDSDQDD